MKSVFGTFMVAGVLLVTGNNAWAAVTVTFAKSDAYSDMPRSDRDKEQILKLLVVHFTKLAAKLPSDQELKIEISDIDLAGRIEPAALRGTQDLRILRGQADWPSMQLHYSLESNGQTLQSGDDKLADMTYLDHYNRYPSGELLRYEKQMIDSWFQKKFIAPPK